MNVVRNIVVFCNWFFLIYLMIYSTYILICSISGSIRMYMYRRSENLRNILEHDFYYPMSIVVPAYNESVSIVQTIENLLRIDYKLFEIVVVDDGSTDNTKNLIIDAFDLKKEDGRPIRYEVPCKPIKEVYTGKKGAIQITLISKVNGGCKADAMNAGINVSEFPYIVNMDADEILQRDALKIASRAILEDDNVVCVGGNIKMSNYVTFSDAMPVETTLGKNMVVDMQVVEYGRAFVGTRIFQNEVNMNLIVSGGYGIFKKSVLVEVGGYDSHSMGEDMEVTVRIHKHFRDRKKRYAMKYVPDSVCWTQAPSTLKDLKKQRQRWYCGLIQTIVKYKKMICNPKYGLIGLYMFPYIIFYEMLNPLFMLLGWFVMIWTILDNTINFPYVIYVFILYFIFGVFLSISNFWDKIYMKRDTISLKKMWIAFYTAIIDSLFFRLYISVLSILALFKLKSIGKKWESPKRVVVNTGKERVGSNRERIQS